MRDLSTTPVFDEDEMLATSTCTRCGHTFAASVEEVEAHDYPGTVTASVLTLVLTLKVSLHVCPLDPRASARGPHDPIQPF